MGGAAENEKIDPTLGTKDKPIIITGYTDDELGSRSEIDFIYPNF